MTPITFTQKRGQFALHWNPRFDDACQVLLIEPKGVPSIGDPATAAPKPRI